MKNILHFEELFKNKTNILLVLDYNGTIAPTEPKINSPLSNTTFKRVLENFSRKNYIKIVIITDRSIKEFKNEFGVNFNEINIYGLSDKNFQNEASQLFTKKEDIILDIIDANPSYKIIYAGDDKLLIKKTKKLNGYTIGILPLCAEGEKLVDFSISQNKFEESLITINNLYFWGNYQLTTLYYNRKNQIPQKIKQPYSCN